MPLSLADHLALIEAEYAEALAHPLSSRQAMLVAVLLDKYPDRLFDARRNTALDRVLHAEDVLAFRTRLGALLPALGLLAIRPMPGVAAHPGAKRPPFRAVLGRIWLHGAVVSLQGIGFAAIGAFFSLHFVHESWPFAGLGLTAFGVGFVLVRFAFGHLPDRIGGLPVAMGSLAVEAAGQLLVWSAGDPTLALAGAFLTGLGCSLVFPAMGREVVHLVEPHLRATALGAFAAFQDVAYGLTGPVAGLLADRAGYGSVFLLGGAAAAAGFLTALSMRRPQAAAGKRPI